MNFAGAIRQFAWGSSAPSTFTATAALTMGSESLSANAYAHDLTSYDTSTTSGNQAGSSYSWDHNCFGAHRVLVVAISFLTNGGTQSVSSITYNGVSLTKKSFDYSISNVRLEFWELLGPDLGLHTITVTLTGAANTVGNAVSLKDIVDTIGPQQTGNAQTNGGSAADAVGGTYNTSTVYAGISAIATDDTAVTALTGETEREKVTSANGSGAIATWIPTPRSTLFQPGWTNVGAGKSWATGSLLYQVHYDVDTASLTTTSQTLTASATFSGGAKTATAALITTSETLATSATFSGGTHTATAALTASNETLAASATFSGGTHIATAALTASSEVLAGVAEFSAGGVKQAAATLITSNEILAASATFSAGTHTATATLTTTSETLAANAASIPKRTATATLTTSSETLFSITSTVMGPRTVTAALAIQQEVLNSNVYITHYVNAALLLKSELLAANVLNITATAGWDFWTCDIVLEPALADVVLESVTADIRVFSSPS